MPSDFINQVTVPSVIQPGIKTAPLGSTGQLGKQDFLKLLMAQMQNQDPMKPMDDSAMIAQMAQFAALEETQSLKSVIQQSSNNQTVSMAANLIGKYIRADQSDSTSIVGAVTGVRFEKTDGAVTPVVQVGGKDVVYSTINQISSSPDNELTREHRLTMMRSMFAAISGLKNHQTFMDVVGNNIANVNTTGFKQSRVTFQDILSQTVKGASGPQAGRGGVNAQQIGLGVLVSGIDTIQSQGTLQSTGKLTDMAIQGDGYFVMSDGKQTSFSRDGAFDLGIDGTLTNPSNGLHVMGWQADPVTGLINSATPAGQIFLPVGAGMTGKASTELTIQGNLDANTPGPLAGVPPVTVPPTTPYNVVTLSATGYDAVGNPMPLSLQFTRTTEIGAAGAVGWTVTATGVAPFVAASSTAMTFNGTGKVATGGTGNIVMTLTSGATTPQNITLDLSSITQLASSSDMSSNTDGASAGSLTTFTVGAAGDITGIYSNGYKQPLGQIALASFANPSGLMKAGGNLFQASPNSGVANIGVPDSGGRGMIATGFLEGSNVDLAQQFTNMIMAERGFQANSRVITTSDEILQDLVNIKR